MSAPSFTDAQKLATQVENRVLQIQQAVALQVKQLNNTIANGTGVTPTSGAVSAGDLATALGSNLTTIQAILAALSAAVPPSA